MKSILRKIRVCNRTQAAIWAREHGYSSEERKEDALSPSPTARVLPRLALTSRS